MCDKTHKPGLEEIMQAIATCKKEVQKDSPDVSQCVIPQNFIDGLKNFVLASDLPPKQLLNIILRGSSDEDGSYVDRLLKLDLKVEDVKKKIVKRKRPVLRKLRKLRKYKKT